MKAFALILLSLNLFAAGCSMHRVPPTSGVTSLGAIERTTFASPHDDYVVELVIDETGHLVGYVWDGTEEHVDEYVFPKTLEPVQFTAGFSLENDLILTGLYTPLGAEAVVTITATGFDFHEVTPTFANWDETI